MSKIFLLCLFFFVTNRMCGQDNDLLAGQKAIVIENGARFTVLTDRLIRLEYQENKEFTDNASLVFVNRNLAVPEFSVKQDSDLLIISTRYLSLHYKKNSGRFNAKNLIIYYKDSTEQFSWHPGLSDPKNLKGTTRTLDGTSGKFAYYKAGKLRLEDGILSRSGWTLIDDSERPLFDHSDWPWVEARKNREQDLYFFGYGKNYKEALRDYTAISGKIALPPKYAFGIWYSKYWNYTDEELKDIVRNYEKHDLPLDVLVIDMDWHITEKSNPSLFKQYPQKLNGWTGFTWEKKYFPDPKAFLGWTNDHHIQTCLNLHPAEGVQPYENAYPAFAKAMGADTLGHPTIKFDITNKKFAENYFKILLHPYEKDGVDFWWLDWQQWSKTSIPGVNPTFFLNYVHFSDQQRQGRRPLIFHRWGGLGNQRYQIGFSGDVIINWRSLRYQPEFTANASNVCFGFWSHDIGGHIGLDKKNYTDPELFTRWVQWGSFSPIFRTHSTNNAEVERRMWEYPAPYFDAMKKAVQLRYSLLPYIYTFARMAYDSSVSLIRPMYYEDPQLELAYHLPHQYYFGEEMIVAPVTRKTSVKASRQSVWLPKGKWYNFYTQLLLNGDQKVNESFEFDQVPLYIKAGSIIPAQTSRLNISRSNLDTLILTVYPDAENHAAFTLYEDDGISEAYRNNIFSKTTFSLHEVQKKWYFSIQPDGREFEGKTESRVYILKMINCEKPKSIRETNSGETLAWVYDEKHRTLSFHTTSEKISIKNYTIDF